MLHFLIFMICAIFAGGVLVILLVAKTTCTYLQKRRAFELGRLNYYHNRLKSSVSTLLARADDLDQESRFQDQLNDERRSQQLAKVVSDLVILADGLAAIEAHLKNGNVGVARAYLAKSCSFATRLAYKLNDIALVMRSAKVDSDQKTR